ncbi:MAG: DUF4404 family protein [Chthoniobacterales bacterium]|nr:DUF4404 family protein [Chthoniobacterales bacterium]
MVDDRIERIESAVRTAEDIPEERKAEVLDLLAQLRSRISGLSETHQADADSIARLVEASTHEATRGSKEPGVLQTALAGLKHSAQGFEASHPEMVESVNQFATVLANMGL